MGRQFSYFCCPEDLAEIEGDVFRLLGGSLVKVERREGTEVLVCAPSFALANELMGKEGLTLYLLPPEAMKNLVYSERWLNRSASHLIEVSRSYVNNGSIGLGRFWYESRIFQSGVPSEKSQEFLAWSQAVFKQTKVRLKRHSYQSGQYECTEWFGKVAWARVQAGGLKPT